MSVIGDGAGGLALAIAAGYLLGSIPFGLLITRAAGKGDIRAIGSGNIGATNVLRTGSKKLAAATLAGDMLKGTLAVVLLRALGGETAGIVAGLGAFLGHVFPVWLGFRGGKGVATYLGVLLGLAWPLAFLFAGLWIAVAALSRFSSLSALVASAAIPAVVLIRGDHVLAAAVAAMAVLLWIRHAANIGRLLSGRESRIGGGA